MSWWDIVSNSFKKDDKLFTPGRGLEGGIRNDLLQSYPRIHLRLLFVAVIIIPTSGQGMFLM